MQPLIIGLLAIIGYGLFLLIRALPRLYRAGDQKLVYCAIVFTLAVPLAVWLIAKIPAERMNIWLALPALVLFGIWVCVGYFTESYRKKKERNSTLESKPAAPPSLKRRNMLIFAAGLIIWLFGAFIGIADRNVEIALLCISMLLLISSIGSFWRYRKF